MTERPRNTQPNQTCTLESLTGTEPFFSERNEDKRPQQQWDAVPMDTTEFITDWGLEVQPDTQKPVRSVTARRMEDPAFATTVFTAVRLNLSARGEL
jgi:hypothetical protein